jgi:hypothetical protein
LGSCSDRTSIVRRETSKLAPRKCSDVSAQLKKARWGSALPRGWCCQHQHKIMLAQPKGGNLILQLFGARLLWSSDHYTGASIGGSACDAWLAL